MRQELYLDGWPLLLNDMLRMHHYRRNRQVQADYQWIAARAREQGLVPARGRRRVSLVYHYIRQPCDPDAALKVLLDGLNHAGLLRNDNRRGLELGSITFALARRKGMVVILEDLKEGC